MPFFLGNFLNFVVYISGGVLMNCGVYCLLEYLKLYDIHVSIEYHDKEISMLSLIKILEEYDIKAEGYYLKSVFKDAPYILFLPKQRHFMLVKKIGWFVLICDQNVKDVYIPYFLYKLIYQGYYLKIVLDNE